MMATWIISTVLAAVVGAAVWKMIRDHRQGKAGCGGGCEGCAASGICHTKE